MRALSVKRPWSELIALGQKTVEVRSWSTKYRGPLLICTSTNVDAEACEALDIDRDKAGRYRGAMCCVVELNVIAESTKDGYRRGAMCDVRRGDFLWRLVNPRRVAPVRVKGRLGLYDVNDSLIAETFRLSDSIKMMVPDPGLPHRAEARAVVKRSGISTSFLDRMRITPKL